MGLLLLRTRTFEAFGSLVVLQRYEENAEHVSPEDKQINASLMENA
jgi:hypothetical protein